MMLEVSADSSSRWNHEVGVENVVQVNFVTWEFVRFAAGAWIEVAGEVFKLRREYKPKHVNNNKYSYSMTFYGREHDAQDLLFCRLNQGSEDMESVFQYEGTPMELLEKVVANMNRNSEGFEWKVGEAIAAPRQSINFNGVFCWDALGQIAQVFETEWWRDGQHINLTKCERGNAVLLGYGKGLRSGLQQNEATNAVKFYTRLIPIGSTKNIDKELYGYERLQLPSKAPYVDVNIELGLKEHREERAFAEIYPHRTGVISEVETENKIDAQEREYTVYFFKDKDLPFDPDDCMLPGKRINVHFVSGELQGKDFEVVWDAAKGRFEIINTYPDDETQLPGDRLIPEAGNEYVLWNLSQPIEYYTAAEEEYAKAVEKFIKESTTDASTYTAQTDYIELDKKGVHLDVGQRVKLLSERYFEGGSADSRITKITRSLDRLNDATIECRNAMTQSWKSSVDNSLNSIHYSVAKELEQVMIELLQTGDKEAPTEYNVFSALRSLKTFLRKDREDATEYFTRFKAGIEAGRSRIGEDGGAQLQRLDVQGHSLFNGDVASAKYISGMADGKGWAIQTKRQTNGAGEVESLSMAEVDELIVRRSLKIFEFVASQILGENDNRIFSGMMEVDHYDADSGRIYLKTENGKLYNTFRAGDVLIVQQYSGELTTKHYELVVVSHGIGDVADGDKRMDWITFGSFAGGNPAELIAEGDTLVRADSMTDESRKGIVQVTSVGYNAPYIDVVRGLKTDPENALKVRLGNLEGVRDEAFGANQPKGSGIFAQNCYLKGTFVLNDGKDIATNFTIQEGLIKSSVQSLQSDAMSGKTVVFNASFTDGLNGWQTENASKFYTIGGAPVFLNNGALRSAVKVVCEEIFGESRFYASMNGTTLKQFNEYFTLMEDMDITKSVEVEFGMKYRSADGGFLIAALTSCDDIVANACRGAWSGASIAANEEIAITTTWGETIVFAKIDCAVNSNDVLIVTKGYRLINETQGCEIRYAAFEFGASDAKELTEELNVLAAEMLPSRAEFGEYNATGRWNGSGDLEISFSGQIDLYSVELYSQPTEVRYATFFEQSDRLIRLAAKNFNADGTVNVESEIFVKPNGAGLVTKDAEGNVATVGTYEDGVVKLEGKHIKLEGATSVGDKTTIGLDGRIKAVDGEFEGKVTAANGLIGKFVIGEGLKYVDEKDEEYSAEVNESRFHIGGRAGYLGLTDSRKFFEACGRFGENADKETVMRCFRSMATNYTKVPDFTPLAEIIDKSTHPGIALKMRGGFVHEGANLQAYQRLVLESEKSETLLRITRGNRWIIVNSYQAGRIVYLPTKEDMLNMLGQTVGDQSFAVPMSVTLMRGSKNVKLRFQPVNNVEESSLGFVNWNGGTAHEKSNIIEAGDTWEFILINDTSNGYYAQLTNHNV